MRIKQLQFLVAPDDVLQFVAPFIKTDRLSSLSASTSDGVLHLRGTYRFGLIPVPVDLAVRVARYGPDFLDLLVVVNEGSQFGAMIHEVALGLIGSSRIAGIAVENSHLILRFDQLAPYLHATFKLHAIAITVEGLSVHVSQVVLYPARPQRIRMI